MSKRIVLAIAAVVLFAGVGVYAHKAHAYYCNTTCFGNSCQTWCN